MLFTQLPTIFSARLVQKPTENCEPTQLFTDSRKLISTPGAVFLALSGPNHNGHQFIQEAYQQGIRLFILEQEPENQLPDAGILLVEDTLYALQQLAAWHRQQFTLPVIAITGSNGKTIVKEWLASLMPENLAVVRSPKSFNSQLGVPLSVWQIQEHHQIGIFEAGISEADEMSKLESIIKPTAGIFTNIGSAHDAGFKNREEKITEKAQLFRHAKLVVYCADATHLNEHLPQLLPDCQLISWSKAGFAEASVKISEKHHNHFTQLTLHFPENENHSYNIPFKDKASLENITHCLVLLHTLELNHSKLPEQLYHLPQPAMRLALKQGVGNSIIIDDAYNNDLAGLEVALGFMQEQRLANKRKTVILSDLLQSGKPEQKLYKQLAKILKSHKIDRLLAIGTNIQAYAHLFSDIEQVASWPDTQSFLKDKPEQSLIQNDLVLVKGARKYGFETIVKRLEQKVHGTVLEINLEALQHNLNFYRSRITASTKIMVMVKAFAYGSGSHEVARLLQHHRVDYLAVAYTDEGVSLRQSGIHLPIMVMNPGPETFSQLLNYKLEPEVYSMGQLQALVRFLEEHQKPALKVHIKVDTGMHRLGFTAGQLEELYQIIRQHNYVKVASIFSHLAGADSIEHDDFSREQARQLNYIYAILIDKLGYKPLKHLVNSAGILHFPEFHFDMVRLGIGLYGADSGGTHQSQLMPISKLLATVSQVKCIEEGTTVGYSRAGKASKPSKIATLSIGYADGYDRRFSRGKGYVLINNQKAPVIGNVCMDMTMVDVTGIEVQEGDEAIIFGPELPITVLAEQIGTIPYEILTSISERVKRVFYAS